jgi:hypothetical protein
VSIRTPGPRDEAHGWLAEKGVMRAVVAILALSRPPWNKVPKQTDHAIEAGARPNVTFCASQQPSLVVQCLIRVCLLRPNDRDGNHDLALFGCAHRRRSS